ncbi:MAG: NADH-quinone oxidoreductase subunit M [Chthonomonadales bacterium]|nr:NADH-quinone oxidoreductase subunit M [Chthonomonadales bacterium]
MSLLENNILSLLIFFPLLGGLIVMFAPASSARGEAQKGVDAGAKAPSSSAAPIAIAAAAVELLLALYAWTLFTPGRPGFQLRFFADWIPDFRIRYDVGVDGMSLLLILLTAFLTLLCVIYSTRVDRRPREYMVFLLVLEAAMMGVFCALDLVLFYVFWELVLIPMYFLIGIWGHERRVYAAVKFFIFTFVGSVLMLVGIVYLFVQTGSFSLTELMTPTAPAGQALAALDARALMWVYAAFALAFMVKVPLFPFHTWLPDAHVEAPTAGSVILAGVLLKMGVYGFIRFCMPLFPQQMAQSAPLFLALCVVGILYGAIVATVQPDMKKLVAYSSVSHLGIVMLGVFSFNELGLSGAIIQSVNHGVSTGMLFFLVGMLYDRRHTREIAAFGGVRRVMPLLSAFFLLAAFSSAALPLTNGFIGEYLVLQGAFLSKTSGPVYAALSALGMVLSATYMLWLFQRAFCGPVKHSEVGLLPDLALREKLVLVPLAVLVLWFGCYPAPWLRMIGAVKPVASARSSVRQAADGVVQAAGGPVQEAAP